MFCGIVSEISKILDVTGSEGGLRFSIQKLPEIFNDIKPGDSIAIDGACHSVEAILDDKITFFSSHETISKTIVKNYQSGGTVNLELPMKLNGRIDGHIVLGHVDATGKIVAVDKTSESWKIGVSIPAEFQDLCIYKGSIALNGVSLTINQIHDDRIYMQIIPITLEKTNLIYAAIGDDVNLEFDVIGKYVNKWKYVGAR